MGIIIIVFASILSVFVGFTVLAIVVVLFTLWLKKIIDFIIDNLT